MNTEHFENARHSTNLLRIPHHVAYDCLGGIKHIGGDTHQMHYLKQL